MTTTNPTSVKRTSYLELFFDLVFVFAITQLAGLLHGDHSVGGWARAVLLAWLVWWAWSQYTWAGNAIELERRVLVRLAVLSVSGIILLAAIAIPDAFTSNGLWFAVPYATIRFAGLALYSWGLRHDPEHRSALRTFVPIAAISPLLVLAGALADEEARAWIWTVAVLVDLASLVSAGRGEFQVAPAHFAERHALIVIIALGESVIAVGASAADLEPSLALVATAAAGFVIIAVLWWDYFDWVHGAAETRLEEEPDHRRRSNLARDLFTLGHFPLVIGPVLFAVGVEEAIQHPEDPLDTFGRLALGGGLVLFLLGFAAGDARAGGPLVVERLGTVVVTLGVLVLLGTTLSAVALLALLAVVCLLAAVVETTGTPPEGIDAGPEVAPPDPESPP